MGWRQVSQHPESFIASNLGRSANDMAAIWDRGARIGVHDAIIITVGHLWKGLWERGTRPVRIANSSEGQIVPGWQMRKQASWGAVDFITGDWLAENNIAQETAAMHARTGEGMDGIANKRIKEVIDGGGLGPENLAWKCQELIDKNGYDLTVAFVSGDNMVGTVRFNMHKDTNFKADDVLACTAYIVALGIVKGLEVSANLIMCARVADASPVIGAAWWWYGWSDTDYDRLAGAFLTGHLVEFSGYITGSNFCGFHRFMLDTFVDHEGTNGMVTIDTVKCQFLYEIQGNFYLNSDVTAVLDNVVVREVGKNRIRFSGIKGRPPPPTTNNAAGYATRKEYMLSEKQIQAPLEEYVSIWPQDVRTADPKCFYVYYPCSVSLDEIKEAVHLIGPGGKGLNINCGLSVQRLKIWESLRSFMTMDRMKTLIGGDWKDEYRLERVELQGIFAVHFVIYVILGCGESSSTLLDNRGKAFTACLRAKHVDVPEKFLQWPWKGG
ncbi:hypothetical protein BCR34DRAFT_625351 [Clohesyomyces aquaticus]|uniref:DUF1446-domain-containing protein n=1 Tax=Clohesyomyces aquaticus TaxID=1231657 RepID=A0A1Y1ZIZ6_9PLEO|nr:hypothetical protein BCR34DRAFT_625351 [Clohesyomyces aquaticus]